MEHTGGEGGIGMTIDKGVAEMLALTGTTAGDDGYREVVGQLAQSLVGITVLHTIVIHTGKQYLACTTLLGLVCPFKQTALSTLASTFQVAMPSIRIESRIDGHYAYLRTKATGNLVNQFGAADGSAVHAHLISSGIQQALYIGQLVNATTHGKGDIYLFGHTCYHIGKRFATLETGCDIQKAELVGTLFAVGFAQFNRVASRTQVYKVGAFNGLAILHVQTGYDSFC